MRTFALVSIFTVLALNCFAAAAAKPTEQNSVAHTPPKTSHEWEKQKKFFRENGYLWIKNFFSEEQVALLQSWSDDVNQASETLLTLTSNSSKIATLPGTLIIVPEAKNPLQACRAEDMASCYPDLYHFITGTLTAYLGKLMDEPYVLFKDKINFKWPGGGAFQPHQDFPAYDSFGPREHITAMVSIDRATLENGCLHVAKNWRETFSNVENVDQAALKEGHAVLPFIEGGVNHGSIQPKYSEKISWLALETSPRDLVLIDSFVPHYSEPNQSNNARRAMFLTHNRLREGDHRKAYYHMKRNDPLNPKFHFATPTKARTKD
jgi:ectoine hydroxylase-related dioxygenase (phytanoyl-CoA dioxygenase family)